MNRNRILILGVTAGGKGKMAFELAKKVNAEIISIDSMKVYRRMNIGTAKPSKEVQKQVNYHLIDVVEPSESFSVDAFLSLTEQAVKDIETKGKPVVAVGGTAMYIKALLHGIFDGPSTDDNIRRQLKQQISELGLAELHKKLTLVDPAAAERIHPNDERRIIRALEVYELTGKAISDFQQQFSAEPKDDWLVIGLQREKTDASHRINNRVKKMFELGLVDEVKALLAEPKPLSMQARCAIGYAEIIDYLAGKETLENSIEQIKINTRRFAKAQRTWFKTFRFVNWLDIGKNDTAEQVLERAMLYLR
ncbi:MAG: tRNA (adenosine(37)-N6)-dimethylallyltransferase MiaA [Planctomycetes bacterium]|nr:tRNA (adenosine(37)-N6)-dimethylallyltransferase MiaA [Planctomycetota bacterium]MBU1517426.1 tRNA (adenosine(37)-N6)-dimethylallyltransferase MiaA [Planctomycetota bacterium]MBU2457786.1 tRNA (adenosine(37)-N6)-dimethylallyltransferase MiaA [Planctomycetota bacterium]MBU2597052.1 tRNA (adenosine(37)-N6)-dimethylallyltransferase MiaA [Planctomycetota bacterium]